MAFHLLHHQWAGKLALDLIGAPFVGDFTVTQGFGETTYVFNISATFAAEPTTTEQSNLQGVYSGTFEVAASYQVERLNAAEWGESKTRLPFDYSILGGDDNYCLITTVD